MARRPIEDERFLVPERVGTPSGRVYVTELARYLDHPSRKIRIFAREHGLLHTVSRGAMRAPAVYVTEEGAMRIIAVVRTLQGSLMQKKRSGLKVGERRLKYRLIGKENKLRELLEKRAGQRPEDDKT